jgi:hypothetical protein
MPFDTAGVALEKMACATMLKIPMATEGGDSG